MIRPTFPSISCTLAKANSVLEVSSGSFSRVPEKATPLRTDNAELLSEGQGEIILLIEDEEKVRNLATRMLDRLGYRVLEAKDGVEALDIFRKHQEEIRCVVSDVMMPNMNGWETLAALRKLSPDIPVIFCSGCDVARTMPVEHTERPNAILAKPYHLQDLGKMIRRVLANETIVAI